NVNKNVSIPILPINIKIIRITLLTIVNSLVIPSLKPTVPNADVTSKNISVMVQGSIIIIIKLDMKTNPMATKITAAAVSNSSAYSSHLQMRMFHLHLAYVTVKDITS